MKILLLLVGCFISAVGFSQTTDFNHLFGAQRLELVSGDTTLPNMSVSREDCIETLRAMHLQSGKIYIACNDSEIKIINVRNLNAVKKRLKKCEDGLTVTLAGCVTKTADGEKSKPFNQIIDIQ